MNFSLTFLEVAVVLTGVALLGADPWVPGAAKRRLGYAAALVLGGLFILSFAPLFDPEPGRTAFGGMYALDPLAMFFKRLFLVAAGLVLVLAVEFGDRFEAGHVEYHALTLFALAGMMFAASANHLALLFVSLELITVTFYVLVSFQRRRRAALEAGVKYLILGACSSALLVYGIALVAGVTGSFRLDELAQAGAGTGQVKLLTVGLLLVFAGLGFKIAAVPFQVWAPDVYQGAPTPTTAFLAVGSKAAGFALLLRLMQGVQPVPDSLWPTLLAWVAGLTILYGNLCAIPQRNLKRLLGYSSIAHAGYLLLGVTALSSAGTAAVLFYLGGYVFTVLAAFLVIALVLRGIEDEDVGALAGLHERAPGLAAALTVALVSLAGVPPTVGFFGKFALITAVLGRAGTQPGAYALVAVALVGVVISLYYYFKIIRVMYATTREEAPAVMKPSGPARAALVGCVTAVLVLGIYPACLWDAAEAAARWLAF